MVKHQETYGRVGADDRRTRTKIESNQRRGSRTAQLIATAALCAITLTSPAIAQSKSAIPQNFVTSSGHELVLPPIAELDCSEMQAVLARIDSTNYRVGNPLPADEADMPLLKYEDALSAALYERCSKRSRPASGAHGFRFMRAN